MHPQARLRVIARESLLLVFFLALAIGNTWPLLKNLDSAVSDPGDPLLNTWILDWSMHALTSNPLSLFDAPMFAGAIYSLAFSEHLVGVALLVLPFKLLAGLTPIEAHNVGMLAGFTLSAYGASVLARTVGASLLPSIVAAISFGFCQFFADHLAHLQVVSAGWLPLTLAALIRLLQGPTWGRALLFAAAFTMNGLSNVYWMLFAGFASVATVALMLWVDPSTRNKTFLVRVGGGFLVAALALLPFLIPYAIVSREYRMVRTWEEVSGGSAHLDDYFRGTSRNVIFSKAGTKYVSELQLAPGLLPLMLAAAAIFLTPRRSDLGPGGADPNVSPRMLRWMDASAVALGILGYAGGISSRGLTVDAPEAVVWLRGGSTPLFLMVVLILWRWSLRMPDVLSRGGRRLPELIRNSRHWPAQWIAFVWIIIGLLASFGAHSFVFGFLFHNFAPFRATRVAGRWAVIVYVGLVILAAIGASLLLRRTRGWKRIALGLLLCLAAVAETAMRVSWDRFVTDPVPVYEWLRAERVSGPIFELPMTGRGAPFVYLPHLADHRVPLINGTSGFSPPWDQQLTALSNRNEFNDAFLALLHARNVQLLIVHADALGTQTDAVFEWIRAGIRDGQFVLVRRFDRGPKGDFVLAVTNTGKDWQRLVRTDVKDAAGLTDRDKLKRLFDGEGIFSDRPLLQFEEPAPLGEHFRHLAIRGWAVAPRGVKSVEVLIAGKHVYRAARTPRPEITAAYPWYPHDPYPGFELVFPKRPEGIPRHTSVQIRITDAEGRVIHSDHRFLRWH